VTLYRCFAWNAGAREREEDGPLWFPRRYQGEGRHDNPDAYGCLYLSDRPVSCVVEQLAPFRGQRLVPALLQRRGHALALAQLELDDTKAPLIDLDDPAVLRRERLRPSRVATRTRAVTQPQALTLFRTHAGAAGLRWWSSWEALWSNVTLFDRAVRALDLVHVETLTTDHAAVQEVSDFFGMRLA
jgi:hypothetical protein